MKTKQTAIPWVGEIPEGWKVVKLKYTFDYITGATPDTGKNNYYSQDGFNWITISDLSGKYTKESKNKITELAVEEKNMKIIPIGALLYSFKLSVGQMSFVDVPTYTNEAIFAILPKKDLNLDFWYYSLQACLINNANENIYGAKIFNQDSINNAILIKPPLKTQKNIANYLDDKTAKIKKLIDDKKKMIELLKEQKQSIIHEAVTKGVEKNMKMKDSGIAWLGKIPEGWEVVKLKYIFDYVTGATPDTGKNNYYSENGFNWITISDLSGKYTKESKNKITELAVEKKNMQIVPTGSLLYSFKLSVGQVSFVELPTYTNEAIFAILPNPNLNLNFWYYALQTYLINSANENIYGAKIFNQDSIDNALLIVPPLKTQKTIVDHIEKESNKINTAIIKTEQEIELIEEYKKSLVYHAVTGKIAKLI